MSQAHKEVMLKSVVMTLPIYAMSCFKLHIGPCQDIDRIMARYWWHNDRTCEVSIGLRGKNWLNISILVVLVFLLQFNGALLGKIGWRLSTQPKSLLSRLLKAKYFPTASFQNASLGARPSWG